MEITNTATVSKTFEENSKDSGSFKRKLGEDPGVSSFFHVWACAVSSPTLGQNMLQVLHMQPFLEHIISGGGIALEIQSQNHQETIRKISEQIGEDAANDHLNSCLYSTYIGSNDYMLNYFGSGSSATREHTPEEFTNDLMDRYSAHLQELHKYGARKIAIFGLSPLGCLPIYQFSGGCNEDVNNAIQFFNSQLRILVDQLNHMFPDARHIFVNTFSIVFSNLSSLVIV
ncbi:hypothetical protein Droror1_Dr00020737 [Drosera rotundifolia]